jgi:CRP-like cAMP-binding protein
MHGLKQPQVQRLLKGATVTEFAAGEIIFREGEPANQFYLIEWGSVELESRSAGRGTLHLDTLHEGDALGWSWLFPPYAWHFQARATQTTRVICCNGSALLVEAEEDPVFGYALMKRVARILIHRLRTSRNQYIESQGLLHGAPVLAPR